MPWTDITRPKYERNHGRYASDCTDAEWALIESFMPGHKKIGRPRTTELRDVWDAIQYMAATGCQWAMIPNDFEPRATIQRHFYDWLNNGAENSHQPFRRREGAMASFRDIITLQKFAAVHASIRSSPTWTNQWGLVMSAVERASR